MKLSVFALTFASGCLLPWLLPWQLPAWLALCLLPLIWLPRRAWQKFLLLLFALGFGYGLRAAENTAQHQIPDQPAGVDAWVRGKVVGLPQWEEQRVRFLFEVESIATLGAADPELQPRLLRLAWYYPEQLQPGEVREFEVRLRRPRGLVNFNAFDYRQWLLAEGVDATGYVRRAGSVLGQQGGAIGRWREVQRQRMAALPLLHPDLLAALGIGDRSGLEAEQWQRYAATGVIHLMVISGLHIGFAALLGFVLGVWALRPLALLRSGLTAQDMGGLCALIFALAYALCAGFSTPTLRAFLMIAMLTLTRLLRLNWSVWTILSLAFALVLALQPSTVLSAGLWMSFGAVVVLVAAFQGWRERHWWRSLVRAQLVLFVGFSAIPLALGNAVPWVAPLTNLVAVPLVGLLVVPLILLGLLFSPLWPALTQLLWRCADFLLSLLESGLGGLISLNLPLISAPEQGSLAALAAIAAGLLLVVVPASLRLWPLLLVALVGLNWPQRSAAFLELHLFDVGQGTAVLISQPGYQLLYDTGPAFSDSFNAGRDILQPWLRAHPASQRQLMVSHSDRDHAGGLPYLSRTGLFDGPVLVGEALEAAVPTQPCRAGQVWQVGEVQYRILHPPPEQGATDNNDRSCVLLIQFGRQSILLPGDISTAVESRLVQADLLPEQLNLILVPHHGSGTSSSRLFLGATRPRIALVSAGYGNAFGHPAPAVLARYQQVGSTLLETAVEGAIRLTWSGPEVEPEIQSARRAQRLWWQE